MIEHLKDTLLGLFAISLGAGIAWLIGNLTLIIFFGVPKPHDLQALVMGGIAVLATMAALGACAVTGALLRGRA